MCGIAGFTGDDEALLHKMAAALEHRGPDAAGFFSRAGKVSLAHTRLSIVDLDERSNQPLHFAHDGKSYVLAFNGEIYNYQELRRELERAGCRFQTRGDSEVILASYAVWGDDCVRRFNGMWAFAIFDEDRNRLFLSRDRFGKKPLYYHVAEGRFVFASEIKAILTSPSVRRVASTERVADFLNFGLAAHTNGTFFRDVEQLPAGSNGVVDLATGKLSVSRYYRLPTATNGATDADVRKALHDAVVRRLISDVPICLSLSGGVDSSSVAAMIAEVHGDRMVAFTTTSDDGAGDETAGVMKLLSMYRKFELVKVPLSGTTPLPEILERIVYHMDEPFIYDSPFVRFKISEAIHQHGFKVSITGEGADELLGGYATASPIFLRDLFRRRRAPRLLFEIASTFRQPDWRPILKRFVSDFVKSREDRLRDHFLGNAERFGCRLPASDSGAAIQEGDFTLKEKLQTQVTTFFLPYLLACNDKMYMAHAVEARAPFLDVELAELLLGIETEKLIVGAMRKYPLRHAMRGLVPPEVLYDRRKIGFASPMQKYLSTAEAKAWIRGLFSDARTRAFVDPTKVIEAFESVPPGGSVGDFLVHALTLELWMRRFDVAAA
jgi:asparagine synthase (glutamine-hydrolysing)